MKTILVTGGAGFIGSHLCERILKSSKIKKLICIDNLDSTYKVAYKRENLAILKKDKRFQFYKVDIRNEAALEKIFKKEKPEGIAHLASKTDTRRSVYEPFEHESVNVRGTINLLELSTKYKVKKFVFTSSSSVYGCVNKAPFSENDVTDFPLAPYGATKKAVEVLCYSHFYNHGLSIACLRLFNPYGPRMRPELVLYKWVENIIKGKEILISGTGKRKRDFTYVGDTADAIFRSLNKIKGYEIINVGNSSAVSLVELLKIIEKTLDQKAKVVSRASSKASVELTYADTKKAKKLLGWKSKVGIEEGVSKFVRWYRQERMKKSL